MKKQIANGVCLAFVSLSLAGCFSNNINQEMPQFAYEGNYDILANGKCELAGSDVDKYNMRLEIVKIPDSVEYKATIPAFWNSAAPSESNPAQPTDKGLSLFFDKQEGKHDVVVNISINMEPHKEFSDKMLMTKFDIYRNENGEEKTVDFVEHYLKGLPEEERADKEGLCVVKSVETESVS